MFTLGHSIKMSRSKLPHFLLSNWWLTWMASFHTCHKDCVINLLIITKTLFFEQMLMRMAFSMSSQQNISWNLAHNNNVAPTQKSGSMQFTWQKKLTIKFSTLFTTKVADFMHFQNIPDWKYIKMNIKWIILVMEITALILKPQNWCDGITVYQCRF